MKRNKITDKVNPSMPYNKIDSGQPDITKCRYRLLRSEIWSSECSREDCISIVDRPAECVCSSQSCFTASLKMLPIVEGKHRDLQQSKHAPLPNTRTLPPHCYNLLILKYRLSEYNIKPYQMKLSHNSYEEKSDGK